MTLLLHFGYFVFVHTNSYGNRLSQQSQNALYYDSSKKFCLIILEDDRTAQREYKRIQCRLSPPDCNPNFQISLMSILIYSFYIHYNWNLATGNWRAQSFSIHLLPIENRILIRNLDFWHPLKSPDGRYSFCWNILPWKE